jgi:hypothetical protein
MKQIHLHVQIQEILFQWKWHSSYWKIDVEKNQIKNLKVERTVEYKLLP